MPVQRCICAVTLPVVSCGAVGALTRSPCRSFAAAVAVLSFCCCTSHSFKFQPPADALNPFWFPPGFCCKSNFHAKVHAAKLIGYSCYLHRHVLLARRSNTGSFLLKEINIFRHRGPGGMHIAHTGSRIRVKGNTADWVRHAAAAALLVAARRTSLKRTVYVLIRTEPAKTRLMQW